MHQERVLHAQQENGSSRKAIYPASHGTSAAPPASSSSWARASPTASASRFRRRRLGMLWLWGWGGSVILGMRRCEYDICQWA